MSRSTIVDVVPFKARLGCMPADFHILFDYAEVNGWMWEFDSADAGNRNHLLADGFMKSAMCIWCINESPYAAGGAMDCSLFSGRREWLEAFLRDFGLEAEIEDNAACQQTL